MDSGGVDLEILAVDDRSSDETGAIMDQMAADHAALTRSARCRAACGLAGQNVHAMSVVAREATEWWLLFTDGDVVFAPEALSRALGFAVAGVAGPFRSAADGRAWELWRESHDFVYAGRRHLGAAAVAAFPIRARGGTLAALTCLQHAPARSLRSHRWMGSTADGGCRRPGPGLPDQEEGPSSAGCPWAWLGQRALGRRSSSA